MKNAVRIGRVGAALALVIYASGCVVAEREPRDYYYDRGHHRYWHEHNWHECVERDRDMYCR